MVLLLLVLFFNKIYNSYFKVVKTQQIFWAYWKFKNSLKKWDDAGFKLNKDKCVFFQDGVSYLGSPYLKKE